MPADGSLTEPVAGPSARHGWCRVHRVQRGAPAGRRGHPRHRARQPQPAVLGGQRGDARGRARRRCRVVVGDVGDAGDGRVGDGGGGRGGAPGRADRGDALDRGPPRRLPRQLPRHAERARGRAAARRSAGGPVLVDQQGLRRPRSGSTSSRRPITTASPISPTASTRPSRSTSPARTRARRAPASSTSATTRTFGVPTVVFRQSCIYGPHQLGAEEQGWLAWFLMASRTGTPITIYGDGKQVRDLLYVDDLHRLLRGGPGRHRRHRRSDLQRRRRSEQQRVGVVAA